MADRVVVFRLLAFVLGFTGLLFLVLALPTHHWTVVTFKTKDVSYQGIWEACRQDTDGFYGCVTHPKTGWRECVKAFLLLSIILYILVIIYLITMVWARGTTLRLIGIDLLLASASAITGASIYTAMHNHPQKYVYGWSFFLAWVGAISTGVSAILCFFSDVDYERM